MRRAAAENPQGRLGLALTGTGFTGAATSERNRAEAERLRVEAIHASRARTVQAALDERRGLGRDLHDGAQQRLINVIFALQAAGRGTSDETARRAIVAALEETQLAIRDLRDIGAGLDPSVLAHRAWRPRSRR